jgi:signal transduction histidine kinase
VSASKSLSRRRPGDSSSAASGVRTPTNADFPVADLLTLLSLPAEWNDPEQPADLLAPILEALEALLPIELSYAVTTTSSASATEVGRVGCAPANRRLGELRALFRDCLGPIEFDVRIVEHAKHGMLRTIVSPFSFQRGRGALVLGSTLLDFPNETETSIVKAVTKVVRARLATASVLRERDEAFRANADFVATIVHELRHPLGPMLMAVEVLKARSTGSNPEEIAIIERQGAHMVRLIDDLSSLSRAARGELQVRKAAIELASAVADGVEEARPLINDRGHELRLDVAERGLQVLADRTRIAEVVANLLGNAAKYTEPGGHIELAAQRDGSFIVLCVRDDGVGISAELLPRVFDNFVRGAPRAHGLVHTPAGRGIGLAVVKHLVSLHGGSVAASSAGVGKGSEFIVRLPALEQDPITQVSRR